MIKISRNSLFLLKCPVLKKVLKKSFPRTIKLRSIRRRKFESLTLLIWKKQSFYITPSYVGRHFFVALGHQISIYASGYIYMSTGKRGECKEKTKNHGLSCLGQNVQLWGKWWEYIFLHSFTESLFCLSIHNLNIFRITDNFFFCLSLFRHLEILFGD